MANAWYSKALAAFAGKQLSWSSDDMRAVLVASTYAPDLANHQYVSDLVASDNGRSAQLANAAVSGAGVLDADDVAIVASNAVACNALVVYHNTGNDATSQLLLYIDAPTTGLPFTPAAGQTVSVAWNSGAGKIAAL